MQTVIYAFDLALAKEVVAMMRSRSKAKVRVIDAALYTDSETDTHLPVLMCTKDEAASPQGKRIATDTGSKWVQAPAEVAMLAKAITSLGMEGTQPAPAKQETKPKAEKHKADPPATPPDPGNSAKG